jgi:uncharacterized protein
MTAAARLVGVISDTHGLLRPEALAALAGADVIVHAGDIGDPDILVRLREIAPVVAVRGNNDTGPWARSVPERQTITVGAVSIHVLHDVNELTKAALPPGVQAVIAGHSHRPRVEHRGGVLFLNPGSAGPRRFTLPVAVARLRVEPGRLEAEIVELDVASATAG